MYLSVVYKCRDCGSPFEIEYWQDEHGKFWSSIYSGDRFHGFDELRQHDCRAIPKEYYPSVKLDLGDNPIFDHRYAKKIKMGVAEVMSFEFR